MRHFEIVILLCVVLLTGCVGGLSGGSSPTDGDDPKETGIQCDVDSETTADKLTPQLMQRINKYQEMNNTDGMEIIIRSENSSDQQFDSTVTRVNNTVTEVTFVFSDQRLIAATAEPDEICQIATHDSITTIGIDREVESN